MKANRRSDRDHTRRSASRPLPLLAGSASRDVQAREQLRVLRSAVLASFSKQQALSWCFCFELGDSRPEPLNAVFNLAPFFIEKRQSSTDGPKKY